MNTQRLALQISISLCLFLTVMLIVGRAYAVTPADTATAASPSASQETLDKQINQLKDRIANKVAQLKLVEKRGVIGTVTEVTNTQITLNDTKNQTRFIDIDELTKFTSPDAKSNFGISDIKKGMTVGVLGNYNKETQRITGRFVDVMDIIQYISGISSTIDRKNGTVTIITADGKSILADIQPTTKTYSYTKDTDLVKSGFSKVQEGQRIIAIGYWDKSVKDKLSTSRLIVFPDLHNDPSIQIPETSDTPTPSK